jgi:hypothetical protein
MDGLWLWFITLAEEVSDRDTEPLKPRDSAALIDDRR